MNIEDAKGGETAYSEDGRQYTVLASLGDNLYVVTPILLDEEDEFYGSAETYFGVLYDKPPVEKYDLRIAQLKEEIASLREEATEWRGILAERERLSKVLRENEALRHIEDVLANRITHFLILSGYGEPPRVETFEEAMKSDEGNWQYKLRLLTLHGRTGGDLRWKINHYSDGSGSMGREAIPFLSKEAAERALKIEVSNRLTTYSENPEKLYGAEKHVAVARHLNIDVPAALTAALLNNSEQEALRMREKAQDSLAAAEALLEKVKAERKGVRIVVPEVEP